VITYHNTYLPSEEVILGCLRKHVGYWCPDDSKMRYGTNQHNNQLIYYIRDMKVVGPAHPSALGDKITQARTYACCGGGFEEMIHNNIQWDEV